MRRAASTPKHFPKSLATPSTLWMTVLASFVCLASMSFWRRLRRERTRLWSTAGLRSGHRPYPLSGRGAWRSAASRRRDSAISRLTGSRKMSSRSIIVLAVLFSLAVMAISSAMGLFPVRAPIPKV